jgi:hypothetical protein
VIARISSSSRYSVCIHGWVSEVIVDLDQRVVDAATAQQYFVNVAGEEMTDGRWEAWLEFIPLDDTEPFVTATETYQRKRADVVKWASTLNAVYIQGAYERAVGTAAVVDVPPRTVATPVLAAPSQVMPAPLDPFEVLAAGETELRLRLQPLTRLELLAIIDAYDLNPAKLSLARLTNLQLITFIVTATQVQRGRAANDG